MSMSGMVLAQTLADGELFIPWSILSMPESDAQRRLAIFVARKVAYLDEFWAGRNCHFLGRVLSGFSRYQIQELELGQQWEAYYASTTADSRSEEDDARVGRSVLAAKQSTAYSDAEPRLRPGSLKSM